MKGARRCQLDRACQITLACRVAFNYRANPELSLDGISQLLAANLWPPPMDQHWTFFFHRVGIAAIAFNELWNEFSHPKSGRDKRARLSTYVCVLVHSLGTQRFLSRR